MAGLGWLVAQQFRAQANRGLEAASPALVMGAGFTLTLGVVGVYGVSTGPIPLGALEMSGVFGAGLASSAAWAWLSSSARPSPAFTRSEIQWLMTAPLRRRDLVAYRLGVSQPALIGLGAVVLLACLPLGLGAAVWAGIGLTLLLELALLNQLFAACTHARLASMGIGVVGRAAVMLAMIFGAFMVGVGETTPLPLTSGSDPAIMLRWFGEQIRGVPVLADLALLPTTTGHVPGLTAALGTAAAMWLGIVALDGPFEEHALRASRPAESARQILPLRARGPIWEAFAWQGLISTLRLAMRAGPILVLGAVGAAYLVQAQADSTHRDVQIFATYSVGLIILAPTFIQSDLHETLRRSTWLFVLPVRARDLVRGSVTAGLFATMPAQLAFVTSAGLLVPSYDSGLPYTRLVVCVVSFCVLGSATYAAFAISNAMVVVWPAWLRHNGEESAGLENVGRLVSATTVRNTLLFFGMAPVLVLGTLAAIVFRITDLRLAIATWGLVVAAGLCILGEIAVRLAARRIDRRELDLLV